MRDNFNGTSRTNSYSSSKCETMLRSGDIEERCLGSRHFDRALKESRVYVGQVLSALTNKTLEVANSR